MRQEFMLLSHHSPEVSNTRLAEKLYLITWSKGLLQMSPFFAATMVEKRQ